PNEDPPPASGAEQKDAARRGELANPVSVMLLLSVESGSLPGEYVPPGVEGALCLARREVRPPNLLSELEVVLVAPPLVIPNCSLDRVEEVLVVDRDAEQNKAQRSCQKWAAAADRGSGRRRRARLVHRATLAAGTNSARIPPHASSFV